MKKKLIIFLILLGCGKSHDGDLMSDTNGQMMFQIFQALSYYNSQVDDCKKEGSVQMSDFNYMSYDPVCAHLRLYEHLIYFYPSMEPVKGETVQEGKQIACFDTPSKKPVINPDKMDFYDLYNIFWRKVENKTLPAGYKPVVIFKQEYIKDGNSKMTGFKIYTAKKTDNYLLCGERKYYRIIEVVDAQ